MHLRYFRVKDSSSILGMVRSPAAFKLGVLQELMAKFPKRKFVFVGDSGEQDPEVYAELAMKFPDQVKAIFIRRVSPAMLFLVTPSQHRATKAKELEEFEKKRWETLFRPLEGKVVCKVFDDPEEIWGLPLMEVLQEAKV